MDISDIKKLPVEEREFFLDVNSNEEWSYLIFNKFTKPLALGIGLQNQFLDNDKQTVKEWKTRLFRKKFTSYKTYKRLKQYKIYFQFIGPYPDYFYDDRQMNNEFINCIKLFLEVFFPGKTVMFVKDTSHKKIEIGTRVHEDSQQLQLYLPG